jgi:hypothetical protein
MRELPPPNRWPCGRITCSAVPLRCGSEGLHPALCTLNPEPCSLHSALCILHPAPCSLHLAPCNLPPAPTPHTLPLTPCSLLPAPCLPYPPPSTLYLIPLLSRNPSAVLMTLCKERRLARAAAPKQQRPPVATSSVTSVDVEAYIKKHKIDETASRALRGLSAVDRERVMRDDLSRARNPSGEPATPCKHCAVYSI